MAPIIKFSTSVAHADPISTCQVFSSAKAGTAATAKNIYISHTGAFEITGCSLFIAPYTGAAYTGSAGQDEDYNEIIGWGDTYYNGGGTPGIKGGFQVSQDDGSNYTILRTGAGSYSTPLGLLATTEGSASDGKIDIYTAAHPTHGEAHILVNIFIPSTETTTGLRFVDFGLKYTYTS
jgi:hypothetical protein